MKQAVGSARQSHLVRTSNFRSNMRDVAISVPREGKFQSDVIRWLKSKGAYVIKTKPGPGVPVGCPDVIFLFEGAWGAIECKASKTARFQPGQQATLAKLQVWSPFVFKAYPENWESVKTELSTCFF